MPAQGTRGSIVVACSQDHYSLLEVDIHQFLVTVTISRRVDNEKWTLAMVYGTQTKIDKILFMEEIWLLKQAAHEQWLFLGDFNLIYKASDKSNSNINRRRMTRFQVLLDEIEMKEVHLDGRRYTWSSGTQTLTQTKIDHAFTSKDWELLYSDCHLQVGGTSMSDHCPMILAPL
jgi:endonuclease/exonuclease/phosphatase family metal-dependent hydrolase